jgi:hypothetical protein
MDVIYQRSERQGYGLLAQDVTGVYIKTRVIHTPKIRIRGAPGFYICLCRTAYPRQRHRDVAHVSPQGVTVAAARC